MTPLRSGWTARALRALAALALALCWAAPVARARDEAARSGADLPLIEQARIEALSDGGTLTLPAGRFRVPPGGLVVDRQITIEGANPGRNRLTSGTFLLPTDDAPVIVIRNDVGNITLRDLIVDGDGTAENGIALSAGDKTTCVTFERVSVWRAVGDGIALTAGSGGAINLLVVRDCISNANGGAGIAITGVAFPRIEGGYYAGNEGGGARIERCESARLRDVYFEHNAPGEDAAAPADPVAQLRLIGGFNHVVDGCAFEDFARPGAGVGVVVDGARGSHIDACLFIVPPGSGRVTGVSYRHGAADNWLGTCTWRVIATPWETLDGSTVEVTRTQAVEK